MPTFGSITSNVTMDAMSKAAADADLAAQTVSSNPLLLLDAATAASCQTAIDNIVADINDLKAKLRAAGLLAV